MWIRRMVAGSGLALVLWALLAGPADAQGLCSASLNGVDATTLNKPSRALRVAFDTQVAVEGAVASAGVVYDVQLEFGGVRWTVASGSSATTSWSSSVDVNKYASRGAGIYKVVAVAETARGATCYGRAYVKVTGKAPWETTAGQVAGAMTGAGVAGTLVAGRKLGDPEAVGEVGGDWLERQALDDEARETEKTDRERGARDLDETAGREAVFKELSPFFMFCSSAVITAMALTIKAMVSDAATTVVAAIGRMWR